LHNITSQAAETALALDELVQKRGVPVTFRNPVLAAYANAIWQSSTAAEVAVTLNEATARAGAQAKEIKR
jgi:hypothetical protein